MTSVSAGLINNGRLHCIFEAWLARVSYMENVYTLAHPFGLTQFRIYCTLSLSCVQQLAYLQWLCSPRPIQSVRDCK